MLCPSSKPPNNILKLLYITRETTAHPCLLLLHSQQLVNRVHLDLQKTKKIDKKYWQYVGIDYEIFFTGKTWTKNCIPMFKNLWNMLNEFIKALKQMLHVFMYVWFHDLNNTLWSFLPPLCPSGFPWDLPICLSHNILTMSFLLVILFIYISNVISFPCFSSANLLSLPTCACFF